jgi:hypothetical protein
MFPPDPPDRISFSDLGLPPRTAFAADSAPRRLPRLDVPDACEPVNAQTLRPRARATTWGWTVRGAALGSAVVIGMGLGLWWISATPSEPISAVIPRIGVPADGIDLARLDPARRDPVGASSAAIELSSSDLSSSTGAPVAPAPGSTALASSTAVMLPEVRIAIAGSASTGSVVRTPSQVVASASPAHPAAEAVPAPSEAVPPSSEEATSADAAAGESAPSVDVELPARPPREAVLAAFEGARSAVLDCAGNRHGTAAVHVGLAPTGRARSVLVEGDFGGSPEGSCIARVLRSTTFPRFTEERVSVVYPYSM